MEIKLELIKREIGSESFLVPIGKSVYTHNGIFTLTELGSFIWDLLPQAENADDILERVLEEYDVDRETAKKDIDVFLEKLRNHNII